MITHEIILYWFASNSYVHFFFFSFDSTRDHFSAKFVSLFRIVSRSLSTSCRLVRWHIFNFSMCHVYSSVKNHDPQSRSNATRASSPRYRNSQPRCSDSFEIRVEGATATGRITRIGRSGGNSHGSEISLRSR